MQPASLLLVPGVLIATVAAIIDPHLLNPNEYDKGKYGLYPTRSFISSPYVVPQLNVLNSSPECNDGSYTMLSPRGAVVPVSRPMILDPTGDLIWSSDGYDQNYGTAVQEYMGEKFLTFWAGNDAVRGHGAGTYYMLNSSYHEVYKFSGVNGLDADLHDFRITDQGTAIYTLYEVVALDLTSAGKPPPSFVWDCLIQEVEIQTGKLLFQWRASSLYDATDSFHPRNADGSQMAPWDYFHVNSVDKDALGNYIVSSRYTHTLTYIDGHSGRMIWVLGGKRNMFTDLSEGRATNFAFQHHVRWHDNFTAVSIFDNQAEDWRNFQEHSRGLVIGLDTTAMTATLRREFINPRTEWGRSQGSMQVLPGGGALMGFGFNAAWTEFAADGRVLCDVHFAAAKTWQTGDVQSYRVLKANWTATPHWPPSLEVSKGKGYVSWNGATEVAYWMLQRTNNERATEKQFRSVAISERTGFETVLDLVGESSNFIRAVALDKNKNAIGHTRVLDARKTTAYNAVPEQLEDANLVPLYMLIAVMTLLALLMLLSWCVPRVPAHQPRWMAAAAARVRRLNDADAYRRAWAALAELARRRRPGARSGGGEGGGAGGGGGRKRWWWWGKGGSGVRLPTAMVGSWGAGDGGVGTAGAGAAVMSEATRWPRWMRGGRGPQSKKGEDEALSAGDEEAGRMAEVGGALDVYNGGDDDDDDDNGDGFSRPHRHHPLQGRGDDGSGGARYEPVVMDGE